MTEQIELKVEEVEEVIAPGDISGIGVMFAD
jgi:hypothetical protein